MILEIGLESSKEKVESFFIDQGCCVKWHRDYNKNNRVIEITYE